MIRPHIRWMIRRNMPEVLDLDRECFLQHWNEDKFIAALKRRTVIGIVAECEEKILGYMVYDLHPRHIEILRFGVAEFYRHCGVGRSMLDRLHGKLHQKRKRIIALVPERNLDAQLFFRACGYRATGIIEDREAIEFVFRAKVEAAV